ncbi:MAG: DUF4129 domain-containing protein, partial [Terracidiphilus sp.]
RLVRYDWLRALFVEAQKKDEPEAKTPAKDQPKAQKPDGAQEDEEEFEPAPAAGKNRLKDTPPPRPTTKELLDAAQTRLALDLAQAGAGPQPAAAHPDVRATMQKVLSGREFRNLDEKPASETLLEKFGAWINRVFEALNRFQSKSEWLGRLLVWGFIVAVCVGLIWALLQFERRWRARLVPDVVPAPGSASARDWQLWLADARAAAERGAWREAIHFLYWAAISRLESKRLWPADRARTPREYLALVAETDPRRARLAALTRSFERTWYGGRPATEAEFRSVEELASGLIAGHAPAPAAEGGRA